MIWRILITISLVNDNNDQIDYDVSAEESNGYSDDNDDDDETHENLEQRLDKVESYIREQELQDYPEVEGVKIKYNKSRHKFLISSLTLRA